MEPKLESWTLVLAGLWNRRIFTPDWVARKLFASASVEVSFAIVNGTAHMVFADGLVRLEVQSERVVIAVLAPDSASLARAESVATAVLGILPETPIKAVGFNVAYRGMSTQVVSAFELPDMPALTAEVCAVEEIAVVRKLKLEGRTLNLRLNLPATGVIEAEFNFHYDAASAEEAAHKVPGEYARNRDEAIRLLRAVYGIEIGNEERHDEN